MNKNNINLNLLSNIPKEYQHRILIMKSGYNYGKSIFLTKPTLILLELKPTKGFYIPDILKPKPRIIGKTIFKNKGYRNFAYLLHGYLTNTSQTLYTPSGTAYSVSPCFYISGNYAYSFPVAINFGGSSNPHDVTRYELYSRFFSAGPFGIWWEEEYSNETRLVSYHRYAIPAASIAIAEVGFYIVVGGAWFLLCRGILPSPIVREFNTRYNDGYELVFPANYTRYFLRSLILNSIAGSSSVGDLIIDKNGGMYTVREYCNYAGSPDVRIGSNNADPSPEHYSLQSEIGALGSQTQSVEIDTTIQECRIVRSGTYTPPTTVNLGEVGLFTQVYDTGGTARAIMVARGVWVPTVTLTAGTTYTIGIVLKLG